MGFYLKGVARCLLITSWTFNEFSLEDIPWSFDNYTLILVHMNTCDISSQVPLFT